MCRDIIRNSANTWDGELWSNSYNFQQFTYAANVSILDVYWLLLCYVANGFHLLKFAFLQSRFLLQYSHFCNSEVLCTKCKNFKLQEKSLFVNLIIVALQQYRLIFIDICWYIYIYIYTYIYWYILIYLNILIMVMLAIFFVSITLKSISILLLNTRKTIENTKKLSFLVLLR